MDLRSTQSIKNIRTTAFYITVSECFGSAGDIKITIDRSPGPQRWQLYIQFPIRGFRKEDSNLSPKIDGLNISRKIPSSSRERRHEFLVITIINCQQLPHLTSLLVNRSLALALCRKYHIIYSLSCRPCTRICSGALMKQINQKFQSFHIF